MPDGVERFEDRWLGPQEQDVARAVGDIALRRADGLWAYQWRWWWTTPPRASRTWCAAPTCSVPRRASVCWDGCWTCRCRAACVPLILDADSGLKLSKQNGAPAINTNAPLAALQDAWRALGFETLDGAADPAGFLARATAQWARRFPPPGG